MNAIILTLFAIGFIGALLMIAAGLHRIATALEKK